MDEIYFNKVENFKGYKFIFKGTNNVDTMLVLTEEEFNRNKDLINWIDFLIKTDQWIPFDLYFDVFNISESLYKDLKHVKTMQIQYMEIDCKYRDINLL